ncbi:MAG: TlpA disulfide reductase family protein, partial [Planctomycetota bacterium]|nr:TlpA disulfide reductase family protein [Planctomycetota bacterium]
QGKKAAGARRRLESVGRPLTFSGESIAGGRVDLARYRGHTVIIQYWASWCEPCKADMAVLSRLLAKYGRRLSVIGVNVDHERTAAIASIREHKISWANIHESGGLDSRPATELGILTLPTMLLIDSQGRVANRNIHASELENELKKRIR